MTTTITDQQRLTVVKHLANGKPLDVVVTITRLDRELVLDIGSQHGYPKLDKLSWAADIIEKRIQDEASTLPTRAPDRPSVASTVGRTLTTGAPAAVLTQPDELRVLLNTAKAHPSKRIQAAADRVFDQIDKVRQLIREDHEKNSEKRKADEAKAAARAEVTRLEEQLAAAKAKLRGTPAPTRALSEPSDGPSAAEIRAWAANNNVQCTSVGRVPATVREAYDDAHMQEAS